MIALENSGDISKVTVGMGGWEIPSFQGVFYPPKPQKGFRKLEYYSQFFDLVEVNATFYNTSLSPVQAHRWLEDVGSNQKFVFTVKLYRGFTHTFDATKTDALAVHRLLDPLRNAEKLKGLVVQFPSFFNKTDKRQAYLLRLRATFPEDRLFLDLRHRSWDGESIYRFCCDNGFNLINVDLPHLPNHMPLNSHVWDGVAYFRMMGRNAETWNNAKRNDRYLYPYSEEELQDLVQRINQLNARRTYVVFHNDRQAFSLANGCQVEHMLYPNKRFKAPESLLTTFPQLKPFCDSVITEENLFSHQ
jgi:uncharacterized protein YecE (DUF72 family)